MRATTRTMPSVVIPAAGLGTRMLPISSRIPKAMIPVNGKPIISWILNHLIAQGCDHFVVVVGENKEVLVDYLNKFYGERVKLSFVEQKVLDGPLRAIQLAQPLVRTPDELIVLGDTIFLDALDVERSFVMASPVKDYWRWCLAERGDDGVLRALYDKPDRPVQANEALVGVYYLKDRAAWERAIGDAIAEGERIKGEYQISSALMRYHEGDPLRVVRSDRWFDCGSIDNYYKSRSALLNFRAFNAISVDMTRGTLTKRSRHEEKLRDEINWYRALPADLKIFTPRLLSYNLEPGDVHCVMEYYAYPTLSEIFLYENVHPNVWENILGELAGVVDGQFHAHRGPAASAASRARDMYWAKTVDRIAKVDPAMAQRETFYVNGEEVPGWPRVADRVRERVEQIARTADSRVIHGDLALSNILYDIHTGIFRFVDPRGSFGEPGIHGDPRYDWAKLLHSIEGKYDFITNDLYRLRGSDAKWELTPFTTPAHEAVAQQLVRTLEERGHDLRALRTIEALLFLSMVPLHADAPSRQMAFWLQGLRLLKESL